MKLKQAFGRVISYAKVRGGVEAIKAAIAAAKNANVRIKARYSNEKGLRNWSDQHVWDEADKYDAGTRALQRMMFDRSLPRDEVAPFGQFLEGQILHSKNLMARQRDPAAKGALDRGRGILSDAVKLLEEHGGRLTRGR